MSFREKLMARIDLELATAKAFKKEIDKEYLADSILELIRYVLDIPESNPIKEEE